MKKNNYLTSMKSELKSEGAVVIPKVFSLEKLQILRTTSESLIESWHLDKHKDNDYWWYIQDKKEILYRIHNLEKKQEVFKKLILSQELKKLSDFIFGAPAKFTACALIYKAPYFSAEVPWHLDREDALPCSVYNFSIYLDSSSKSNGALAYVRKSHVVKRKTNKLTLDDHISYLNAKPGDVAVHDVRVLHGSAGTLSKNSRRSIVIEFQLN